MKKKNIIFFSVEGVLNNDTTDTSMFDEKNVAHFRRIIAATDAILMPIECLGITPKKLAHILRIPIERVHGTVIETISGEDFSKVKDVMRQQLRFKGEEIGDYVIIAVDADCGEGDALFRTTYRFGLTQHIADAVIHHMRSKIAYSGVLARIRSLKAFQAIEARRKLFWSDGELFAFNCFVLIMILAANFFVWVYVATANYPG